MSAPASPPSELLVLGVVTSLGPFGLSTRDDGWMLGFHVRPWRLGDGPLHMTELRVTKPMPEPQIDITKAALAATSVVSFRIRDLEPTARGTHIATLVDLAVLETTEPELEAAAAELRVPIELRTETLGVLRLDRRINVFEGEIAYSGRGVQLSIPCARDSSSIDAEALAVAIELVVNLSTLDLSARQFASSQLLELKNDSWLDDDESELSEEEFQQRLALAAVSAEAGGGISLYYDDGDLFFGHSIDVRGTVAGEFREASISG
jgi:hypothetical protein